MHALFKCEVFGNCEGNLRCDQTLDDRVICKIDKHGNMVQNAALAEGTFKVFGNIVLDAHSCEYDGEVIWISDKAEFTPKTIQTRDERANLVYPVKIAVHNDGLLKIGMYADVKFSE